MSKKNFTNEQLRPIREAIELLDGWEGGDPTDLDVELDTLASALSELRAPQGKGKVPSKEPTLSNELAHLVESGVVSTFAVALADEIAELIRTKDYVGYNEGYVENRLSELVSELCGEMNEALPKLVHDAHA